MAKNWLRVAVHFFQRGSSFDDFSVRIKYAQIIVLIGWDDFVCRCCGSWLGSFVGADLTAD